MGFDFFGFWNFGISAFSTADYHHLHEEGEQVTIGFFGVVGEFEPLLFEEPMDEVFEFVGDYPGFIRGRAPNDGVPMILVVEDLAVGVGNGGDLLGFEEREGSFHLLQEEGRSGGPTPIESFVVGGNLHVVENHGVWFELDLFGLSLLWLGVGHPVSLQE